MTYNTIFNFESSSTKSCTRQENVLEGSLEPNYQTLAISIKIFETNKFSIIDLIAFFQATPY